MQQGGGHLYVCICVKELMHNKGDHQEWTRLGGRPQGTSDYRLDVKKDDAMRNENTAQKIEKVSSEWGGGDEAMEQGGCFNRTGMRAGEPARATTVFSCTCVHARVQSSEHAHRNTAQKSAIIEAVNDTGIEGWSGGCSIVRACMRVSERASMLNETTPQKVEKVRRGMGGGREQLSTPVVSDPSQLPHATHTGGIPYLACSAHTWIKWTALLAP
jgi:hypothetical protein